MCRSSEYPGCVLTAAVSNGRILCAWDVVYTADNDDSSSVQELHEKGYTVPEYVFTVECGGVKSGKSPLLKVYSGFRIILKDKNTGKLLKNKKISLWEGEEKYKELYTDDTGYIELFNIEIGYFGIKLEDSI